MNLLEETYGLGNAISDQSYYYDVKRIRDAGLTFIRTSHYPHAPAFYDACDALGVLVMDAQTGWQFFRRRRRRSCNNSYQELRDMIRRDRNHPSVIIWEANLNESQLHRRLGADGQQHRARRVPGQSGVLGAVVVHARATSSSTPPSTTFARRPTRGRS